MSSRSLVIVLHGRASYGNSGLLLPDDSGVWHRQTEPPYVLDPIGCFSDDSAELLPGPEARDRSQSCDHRNNEVLPNIESIDGRCRSKQHPFRKTFSGRRPKPGGTKEETRRSPGVPGPGAGLRRVPGEVASSFAGPRKARSSVMSHDTVPSAAARAHSRALHSADRG